MPRRKKTPKKKKQRRLRIGARKPKTRPRSEYPNFIITREDAPEDFVKFGKESLRYLDFEDRRFFSEAASNAYQELKQYGWNAVLAKAEAGREFKAVELINPIGDAVFTHLKDSGEFERFIPFCDMQIRPSDSDFEVRFISLRETRTSRGSRYYSRFEPKVRFDGRDYIVAFSRHAIERITERTVGDWRSYLGAGDAFAFLAQCVYFEPCTVLEGRTPKPAVTFYDSCYLVSKKWAYVTKIFEGAVDYGSPPYYRVGYCPVDLENGFAMARTLLTPGMRGTPERELLNRTNLKTAEKEEVLCGVEDATSYLRLVNTGNFHAVKWFHDHGIPQVMNIDETVFDHS